MFANLHQNLVAKTMDYQHHISETATKLNDFFTEFKGDLME
jgi:hypothetical protein